LKRILGAVPIEGRGGVVFGYKLGVNLPNTSNQGSEKKNAGFKYDVPHQTNLDENAYQKSGQCHRDSQMIGSAVVPYGAYSLGAERSRESRAPLELLFSKQFTQHFFMSEEDASFCYQNKVDPMTGRPFLDGKVWCATASHFVRAETPLLPLRKSVVERIRSLQGIDTKAQDDLVAAFAPSAQAEFDIKIQKIRFTDKKDPSPLRVNTCDVLNDFFHFPLERGACPLCVDMYILLVSLKDDIDVSHTLLGFQKKSLDESLKEQFAMFMKLNQSDEEYFNEKKKGKGKRKN